ncbi:hypothetical protein C5167_038216 [Papaver somniferum]|uniref:Uncharacterized protein n=1 Tax=Papaver somniferum TaxID=3469 RepID=A0A4Y7I8W9_PAPSO|nr:hypothetical protein C5167_038216 [Papaver somniferum]
MEVYIKFQFYVRVVGTHRWFTVNYTLLVLLVEILLSCEGVPAIFWSVRISLAQLLDLWFSPTMRSSWTESLAMGMNLLVWTDDYIVFSVLISDVYERISISERVADYIVKNCDTGNHIFKNSYFYFLLRQILPYTSDFTKRMKFFTSEGATIAVPRPSQKNSPNSVQADFYATTFFVVLMDVKRDVTEVLAHQLQVESSVFEVLLWESNIILVDIEVQEMLLGVHTMLDSELLDFVLGCLWASQGELVILLLLLLP